MKRRRRSVWNETGESFIASAPTVVEIEPGTEIRFSKRPIGRPRINPPGQRYAAWKLRTPSGLPLICRRRGCNKRLRKGDVLVCSAACRDELRYFCESVLRVLSGAVDPVEFPIYFRSGRLRAVKSGKR